MSQQPAIGILFGSQYITVAFYNGKAIDIITTIDGSRSTPVFITKTEDEWMVGESSKEQHIYNMQSTTTNLARVLAVEAYANELFSYLVELIKSHTGINVNKQRACVVVDQDNLRELVVNALSKHFASVTSLSAPSAALVAYQYDLPRKEDLHIATLDIGGHSACLSVLKADTQGYIHHVATFSCDDDNVTGDAVDALVMGYLFKMFAKKAKCIKNINELSKKGQLKLQYKSEEAKCVLSSTNKVQVDIAALFEGIDMSISLTRSRYEILLKPAITAAETFIKGCLEQINVKIDHVLLMGGNLLIPKIRSSIESLFKKLLSNDVVIQQSKPLREVAAEGAALQGSYLAGAVGNSPAPNWVTLPHAVEVQIDDAPRVPLFAKDTPLPVTSKDAFNVSSTISLYHNDQRISSSSFSGSCRISMLPSGECLLE